MANKNSNKFSPPLLSSKLLERAKLFQIYEQALEYGNIFVSGRSGCGKSTCTALWLKSNKIKHIWINLEKADNDFFLFFNLFNHFLEETEKKTLIILDNFQVITNKKILSHLILTIKKVSKNFHFLMISQLPPLPSLLLSILKTELCTIEQEDLKFTAQDISALFQLYGILLPENQTEKIEQLTGGFIFFVEIILKHYNFETFSYKKEKVLMKFFYYFKLKFWDFITDPLKIFLMRSSLFEKIFPYNSTNFLETTEILKNIWELRQQNIEIYGDKHEGFFYSPCFRAFLLEQLECSNLLDAKKEYCHYAESIKHSKPETALIFF